jgi:hypothetical protein
VNQKAFGQLAQHFFNGKILQKLLSVKNWENSCYSGKIILCNFGISGKKLKKRHLK